MYFSVISTLPKSPISVSFTSVARPNPHVTSCGVGERERRKREGEGRERGDGGRRERERGRERERESLCGLCLRFTHIDQDSLCTMMNE